MSRMEEKEQGRGAVRPLTIAEPQTKLDQSVDEDAVPLTPTASGAPQGEPQVQISSSGDARYRAPPRSTQATSQRVTAQLDVSRPTRENSQTAQSSGNIVQETGDPGGTSPEVVSSHPDDGAKGQQFWEASPQPGAREQGGDDDGKAGAKGQDEDSLEKDVLKGVSMAVNQALEKSIQPVDSEEELKKPKPLTEADITDAEIEEYRLKFPDHLKTDYYDAMIIYERDTDMDEVNRFLKRARTEVLLNRRHKPLIILFDEIFPNAGMNPIKQLDDSLQYCTYVFLYVTKAFCVDGWTEFSSQTALMDAILTPDKRWSVVPIFTEPKRRPTYKVPPSVRSLKGIQYWSEDKFYADALRKLLEDKLEIRLKREAKLKHDRKLWILEKKTADLRLEEERKVELQLKEEEEERNQRINQLCLQQHMHRERQQKFTMPEPHEMQQMRNWYTPKSGAEYLKSVLQHAEMSAGSRRETEEARKYEPSSSHFLSSSSSEPASLSDLGERYAGGGPQLRSASEKPEHYPSGFAPGHMHPGFQGYLYQSGSMHSLPHHQSDPMFQYKPYPEYPGYCGPWSGSPGGYSDSGFDDGATKPYHPLASGYHPGPVSRSPHGGGYPPFPGVRSLFPNQPSLHRFSPPESHYKPAQSLGHHDAHYAQGMDSSLQKSGIKRGSAVPSGVSQLFTSKGHGRTLPVGDESSVASGQGTSQLMTGQEGEFHSLPPGVGVGSRSHGQQAEARESDVTDKPAFSSLPPRLNVSSGEAVRKSASSSSLAESKAATTCRSAADATSTPERQAVRLVGNGAGDSGFDNSSKAVARDNSRSIPPQRKISAEGHEKQSSSGKDDLEVDYPSNTYQSSLSHVKTGVSSYDSRQPHYSGAGQTSMYGPPGSVAEHIMSTQGPGHHSDSRMMHPSYPHGGMAAGPYGHPPYGPAPYHQYPGMPGPAPYPGHGYPPYSHAPPVPYSSQYFPAYYPPRSAAPPVYTEPAPLPPAEVVHHHYHHEQSRENVPRTINIAKVENVMMGDRIEVNKGKKSRERGYIQAPPPPPYELEMPGAEPAEYLMGPEQHFHQYVGSEELEPSGEMEMSRGGGLSPQTAGPSIPSSSPHPGSRLTAMVSPDQSRGAPSYGMQPSNENPEEPLSSHTAHRDLPTGMPGYTQLEPATYPAGNTAMMTQGPGSWRQEHDAHHETCPKRPGVGGEYEPAEEDDDEQTRVKKPL